VRDQRGGASIGGQPCDAGAIQTSAPATTTQYAYAGGGATDPASCPETTNSATQCTLDDALGLVYGADSIMLMTPGIEGTPSSYFNANLVVTTQGTTSTNSLTIEPGPGVANPIVDGGGLGSVLVVDAGVNLAIEGLTIQDGTAIDGGGVDALPASGLTVVGSTFINDSASSDGGAMDLADGQTLNEASSSASISNSTFTGNSGYHGGAVLVGSDNGEGTLAANGSTFSDNAAPGGDGGAIDVGDGGGGTLNLSISTFFDNSALDGGAIDSGDGGNGTLTIVATTFASDSATADGVAIDTADDSPGHAASSGIGPVTAAGDVFAESCAENLSNTHSHWTDDGFNASIYATCGSGGSGDVHSASVGADIGSLTDNGGATETLELQASNPAIGLIPHDTTVDSMALCPVTDHARAHRSQEGELRGPDTPGSARPPSGDAHSRSVRRAGDEPCHHDGPDLPSRPRFARLRARPCRDALSSGVPRAGPSGAMATATSGSTTTTTPAAMTCSKSRNRQARWSTSSRCPASTAPSSWPTATGSGSRPRSTAWEHMVPSTTSLSGQRALRRCFPSPDRSTSRGWWPKSIRFGSM
jgi:hypothetical protein